MLYLDTNLLIVYLTNTPPEHGLPTRDLFRDLSTGAMIATTTEGVLVEATFILSSKKGLAYPRELVAEELTRILSFRGLRLHNLDLHIRALARFGSTNLDYVDCILIESADGPDDAVVSFDRDYDRVRPGLRLEPPFGRQESPTLERADARDQEIEDLP